MNDLRAVFAGRYDVKFRIGGGGAANVYAARDVRDEKTVAIKVYSGIRTGGVAAERCVREIKVTAQLSHPNILPVLESGLDGKLLYYVMPYAASGTLADRMMRGKQLSVRRVCRMLGELADALSHAHGRGIVHRDIKPENIMLFEGRVLLADFGIAKALRGAKLSVAGVPLGTPDFMAPEQVLSRPVDGRTDVYALGALAYEMLVGEPLFPRKNAMQTMAAHVSDEPPALQARRSDLPVSLTEAIQKCLAKDADHRWQSMDDLARVIAAVEARSSRPSSDAWCLPVLDQPPSLV